MSEHDQLYRAEARREHNSRVSVWRGKWKKDREQAIAQAKRWQVREPKAVISVVSTNGMRATLEEMDKAQASRNAL